MTCTCNTYNDLSPARCSASDITHSEFTDVVIFEIRVGKFRKIETAEAIYRLKTKYNFACVILRVNGK